MQSQTHPLLGSLNPSSLSSLSLTLPLSIPPSLSHPPSLFLAPPTLSYQV